jgi:hypothetical protein
MSNVRTCVLSIFDFIIIITGVNLPFREVSPADRNRVSGGPPHSTSGDLSVYLCATVAVALGITIQVSKLTYTMSLEFKGRSGWA